MYWISLLTAGCDTYSNLAAALIEPVSITALNTSMCRSLNTMGLASAPSLPSSMCITFGYGFRHLGMSVKAGHTVSLTPA